MLLLELPQSSVDVKGPTKVTLPLLVTVLKSVKMNVKVKVYTVQDGG